MKIWYHKSKELCSFYYHPFTWNKLLSMFDCDEICVMRIFQWCWHDEHTFYKSWFGCSPAFVSMIEPMKVRELRKLVKTFVKWPHEFKLAIGNVKVGKSYYRRDSILPLKDKILNQLLEKLNVSHSFLELTFENKLVLMKSSGVKNRRSFTKSEDLLDHIYNELMKKESPDYFKFIDALDATDLE
ncbi:MAG: hypothetical protein IPL24_08120 [Bacteroidetes bacterium]|nr:hypothetical protein [Bacteroidota bacterium]